MNANILTGGTGKGQATAGLGLSHTGKRGSPVVDPFENWRMKPDYVVLAFYYLSGLFLLDKGGAMTLCLSFIVYEVCKTNGVLCEFSWVRCWF